MTTRSVLAAAGVGSTAITPLSAALVWVLKDGFGMIGSLAFAYLFAEHFEVYTKEWRLGADVLNNIGLTLDLVSSQFPKHFLFITSVSVLCKSCCGLVAGATKGAHRTGHLADVTVKEGTQETAVALCGLLLGMVLTSTIGSDETSTWVVFLLLLVVHQAANYRLVRVLEFDTLNPQRCCLIVTHVMRSREGGESSEECCALPTPKEVAARETFSLPLRLAWAGPTFGQSMQVILDGIRAWVGGGGEESMRHRLAQLAQVWAAQPFLVGLSPAGRVAVCLQDQCGPRDLVKAHFVGFHVDEQLRAARAQRTDRAASSLLGDLHGLLMVRFAHQALRFYDEKIRDNLFPDAPLAGGGDRGAGTAPLWNAADLSSLKPGEWRYSQSGSSKMD